MMFRPAHPRVTNYRPRFNTQEEYQWRTHQEPRAFYGGNNRFRPRLPYMTENSNLEHWCETCDRGFPTANNLEEHKLQHQKCNIDGCQFVAHPKVITKHIQMQHSSGLYKKISKLNNAEEIKKWREERKKNFPTRSNIEKKAAELNEKIDRGEKMGLKQGQRFRNSLSDNKRKWEPGNKYHNDKKHFKKQKICNENKETKIKHKPLNSKNTAKYLPPVEDKIKITPFSGIQKLINSTQDEDDAEENSSHLLIEDDHEIMTKNSQETSNASKPVLCEALVALMSQYGSSDEEENNKNEQVLTKTNKLNECTDKDHSIKNNENSIATRPSTSCDINIINDGDSGPEETKILKNCEEKVCESTQKETIKNVKKKQHDKIDNKPIYNRKQKSRVPSTLLQKLLFKEMQSERNMVLQCVRYVISNNYFEK